MLPIAYGWQTTLWLAWLTWAIWITAGPFRSLVEAFRNPGPEYYRLLIWTLPVFAAALGAYLWVRRAGLWRYEPVIVAGSCCVLFFFYHPLATLLLMGLFLGCYAAGAWLRDLLQLATPIHPESEIPLSTALGIAMLGPVLFLLGLFHLYYWWISAAVLAVPCIFLRRRWMVLAGSLKGMWHRWKDTEELRNPLAGLSVVYIAIAAIAACVVILAPSIAFDAIHMHLREAFYYADRHELTPLPGLEYSYFPGAYEVLISMLAGLGGQAAAQLLSAMFSGLTVLLAVRLAREAGSSRTATLAGVAALVTMPVFHWTGSVAKNDLMMSLFELAALECFLRWRRDGNFRWILAGAFLGSSAFDVKHVALFGAIPLGGMFLFAAWRQPAKLPAFAKLVLVLVLAGTYWHVRAFALTGNPLYPTTVSRAEPVAELPDHHSSWLTGPAVRYAQIVWAANFDGRFAFEGPLRTPLGIVLVMFLPAWILFRKKHPNRTASILLLFTGLYFAYWIYTSPVLRYALPALILLFVLTGSRVGEWFEQTGFVMRASLLGAMAYALTFAMLGTAIIGLNGPQLKWLTRQIDDHGYLHEASSGYRVCEFLSKAASPEDNVLGLAFFASIYAPPLIHIDGFPIGPNQNLTPEFLAKLRDSRYRWIVVLRTAASEVQAAPGVSLSQRFEDNYFVVFHKDR